MRAPAAAPAGSLEARVVAAYRALADEPGAWVSLRRLRPFFADVPRDDLDEALRQLSRSEGVTIAPSRTRRRSPRRTPLPRSASAGRRTTCWRSACDERGGTERAGRPAVRLGAGARRRVAAVALPRRGTARPGPPGRARRVDEAAANPHGSPLGLVVQGQRGSGKTHLLGVIRQQVQERDGYFFLVGLLDAGGFWDGVLAAMLDGLSRPVPGSRATQLKLLLRRLSALVGAPRRRAGPSWATPN
ncbi:hypothetical protein V2I01_15175 [Micromonospora sp. BRA006-A]|nr:hypothetical protein [Micromonospora sp. BRA006-A]